jgi:cyclohexanecarboxyl-CoA dehydrogenase
MADMGMRPLARGDIVMDGAFVPEGHLCGNRGRGFAQVMGKFDFSRAAIGLMCLGAARRSIDEAAEHAVQRHAFGKPIAAFQGVSFPLAEAVTAMEGARWICYRTLWLRAQGKPHTVEAAMSKWHAPRVAKEAIETAITTVGHGAYSEEMAHQARLRDVFGYLIADGTAQIQKLIIATDLIGREVRL